MDAVGAGDDAVALVSELATKAVVHARTPYTIVVNRDRGTVRVEVHDLSQMKPRLRAYGLDATTGRGLRLVATISSGWGVVAEADGKAVWFEVQGEGSGDVSERYAAVDRDALLDTFNDGDDGGSPPVATVANK